MYLLPEDERQLDTIHGVLVMADADAGRWRRRGVRLQVGASESKGCADTLVLEMEGVRVYVSLYEGTPLVTVTKKDLWP